MADDIGRLGKTKQDTENLYQIMQVYGTIDPKKHYVVAVNDSDLDDFFERFK